MFAHLVGVCLTAWAADAPPVRLLPEKISLARAVVLDEEDMPRFFRHTLRIEHVYAGDSQLIGRTFRALSAAQRHQGSWNGFPVVPRLAVGEVAIWLIKDGHRELYPQSLYNYMRWPARVERPYPSWPQYETISEFAERVEAVGRLRERGEVIGTLERLVIDKSPYVSSWAISRLAVAAMKDEDIARFLEQLVVDPLFTMQGQVELDKALIEVRGTAWRESQQRFNLFRAWLGGELDGDGAQLVVTRLQIACQHPNTNGFPQDTLLRLAKLLAENEQFPITERANASIILMWAVRRYDTDEKVFEMGVELVGSDLPEEVRRSVAWIFVHNFDLDEARRKALAELRRKTKEKPVIDALDAALARPDKLNAR